MIVDRITKLQMLEGLSALARMQKVPLKRLDHLDPTKEVKQIYGNALMIEAAEFVNETGWKPWKNTPPDLDKVSEEFVDLLHFIGSWLNLLDAMGLSQSMLVDAFAKKYDLNDKRLSGQVAGYGTPQGGFGEDEPSQ